ncbi:MAG TPA: hypothetical protein VF490_17910 [Chryseosolibacter sp.]
MKSALVFVVLLGSASIYGQEKKPAYSAFILDNKEVIWVQVYETAQPSAEQKEQLIDLLKQKAWIDNLSEDGSDLIADVKNFRVDYKRYGGKYMNTSNLIRSARWSGKVQISFKDERYRVVVYGLEYEARVPVMASGKMSNESRMVHGSWTDWVLNNYRTHFRKSRFINMDIMHFNLKDSFTVTDTRVIDDEW